jgi:ribose transport system ATP-binding protein
VIGLAGLAGAGRPEGARCIFRADRVDAGEIQLDGKPVTISSPRDAVRLEIVMAPEDRKPQALILPMAVRQSLSLPVLDRLGMSSRVFVMRQGRVVADMPGAEATEERNMVATGQAAA